jgi:hypothetical protein
MPTESDRKMIEAPISTPPLAYMKIISPLIEKAKGFLEAGEKLKPFAFVGNLTSGEVMPVMIASGSSAGKDRSAREIQRAAMMLEADFVFTIMEAWSLRPDKVPQADAIMDKYGSIGASPYTIDVCTLSLETKREIWVAQPPIKPKGISKKKRTIQSVEFRFYTEAQGRFMQLLIKSADDDPPAILH